MESTRSMPCIYPTPEIMSTSHTEEQLTNPPRAAGAWEAAHHRTEVKLRNKVNCFLPGWSWSPAACSTHEHSIREVARKWVPSVSLDAEAASQYSTAAEHILYIMPQTRCISVQVSKTQVPGGNKYTLIISTHCAITEKPEELQPYLVLHQ